MKRSSERSNSSERNRRHYNPRPSRDYDRNHRDYEREEEQKKKKRARDHRDYEHEEEQKKKQKARMEKLAEEREREKEIEAIKEQYLGVGNKQPKKRVIKPSDKFRFSFDWDYTTEDTSRDVNSLYQNPHQALLLFGRGFRAVIGNAKRRGEARI